MAEPTVRPFSIRIPESDLDSLQQRLAATRWPDAETPQTGLRVCPWPMPKSSVTTGKMIISGESARRTSTVFRNF